MRKISYLLDVILFTNQINKYVILYCSFDSYITHYLLIILKSFFFEKKIEKHILFKNVRAKIFLYYIYICIYKIVDGKKFQIIQ